MPIIIFWIGILVVFLFLLFIFRRYLGRILILLVSLVMVGGIFYLLNPTATKSFFQAVKELPNMLQISKNTPTSEIASGTSLTETEKNPEDYSWFASRGQHQKKETLGNLITTGESSENSTNTENETTNNSLTKQTESPLPDEQPNTIKAKSLDEDTTLEYTRTSDGVFSFDANLYEVGVRDGYLIITPKSQSTSSEKEEVKTGSNPQITKVQQTTTLSERDLQEANTLFN